MSEPNESVTYYCRGRAVGVVFGGHLGRMLEQQGCKDGTNQYNFRKWDHPLCKSCRKLVDPSYSKGNGAWFMLEEGDVKELHDEANEEDEEAHRQWSAGSSSRRRSRSPMRRAEQTTVEQIGWLRVKDCTVEQLMRYIRSIP